MVIFTGLIMKDFIASIVKSIRWYLAVGVTVLGVVIVSCFDKHSFYEDYCMSYG